MAVRLVLIDDHELTHAGMRMLCATRPDVEIIASFTSARPALEWLSANKADLVVLDLDLPDLAGAAVLAQLRAAGHQKVVILTGSSSGGLFRNCLNAGALAIVSKADPVVCALDAIDAAMDGRAYVSPVAKKAMAATTGSSAVLPPRQFAILQLLAEGLSNKEISYRLGIAMPTVSFHLAELRRRLGATNNSQLVSRAVSSGLLINSTT